MEKYFKHVEESRFKKREEEIKWRTEEEKLQFFITTVVNPALEDLTDNKRFRYDLLESKETDEAHIASYKIELKNEVLNPESEYNLIVVVKKYVNQDNLNITLKHYNTGTKVEASGKNSAYSKKVFSERLEKLFIELYNKIEG